MLVRTKYMKIRALMKPGDVVGFNGRGPISWLIRTGTGIPTHLALVATPCNTRGQKRVELVESTSLKLPGKKRYIGVQRTYLSERLLTYKGEIWWFPLADWAREKIVEKELSFLLDSYVGTPYDFWQALRNSWPEMLPRLIPVRESRKYVFCSELIAFIFKAFGILPLWCNPSTVSPNELIKMELYSGTYYQLSGPYKRVPGYNSLVISREAA